MLDSKMKEICRICGRELCGNQRRWIFHTASKLNLQVILSHVLGTEVSRDGKAEFSCSKCTFMLERIYRFDTVIARIEALSIERLQKLLSEKDRLKHCLASLYKKNNSDEASSEVKAGEGTVDISNLPDVKYSALLQEDFAYSGFEAWTELDEQAQEPQHCQHTDASGVRPRRCRGCSVLRVADSDYEAICKVPRKVAKSITCGPSTRCSASICNEEITAPHSLPTDAPDTKAPGDGDVLERMSSSSSVESFPTTMDTSPQQHKEDDGMKTSSDDTKCDCCPNNQVVQSSMYGSKLDFALSLVKTFDYRPVQIPKGSKIPVKSSPPGFKLSNAMASSPPVGPSAGFGFPSCITESPPRVLQDYIPEPVYLQDLWQDIYEDYMPLRTQNLIEKQRQDTKQFEALTEHCVSEMETTELEVQSLQGRFQKTETSNKVLQDGLHQMTAELNSAQESARNQDRIIQSLKETLQSRDNEVAELYHVIEEHSDTIVELQNMLQKKQIEHLQASQGTPSQQQLQILELQNSLFTTQVELQKQQRYFRQKERQMTDTKRSQRLLKAELLEEQQQKETTWKHNQELHGALHKLQSELQVKSQLLQNLEEEKCTKLHAQEQSLQLLKQTLSQKEQLLQEYTELLEYQHSLKICPGGDDRMLERLRQRIRDRDAALERAVDDKFCALEEKEKESEQLKQMIRERERDTERLRGVIAGNEETINSLDNLVKAKDLELEQISAAYKNLQWLKKETEERMNRSLKERESVAQQLQHALQDRTKEMEEMVTSFTRRSELGSNELLEELQICLQRKEKMLQDSLQDRKQQAEEHTREIQELLTTIASEKMDDALVCRNCAPREQQNSATDESMDQSPDINQLQALLQEKEQIIQGLTQEKTNADSSVSMCIQPDSGKKTADEAEVEQTQALENDLATAKDELQLVLRKERENKLEVSALQSIIMKQSEQLQEQAADMEALSRSLNIKEELIKDLQMQLVDPEEMPTVERLTQEVFSLKEHVATMGITGQEPREGTPQKLSKVLEELAADRTRLNEALQTEKQLYSSLVQYHTDPDSFKNSSALQAELLTAQALRGQLEDTLGRATERLSQLETGNMGPPVNFGGLNDDEDDDEDSSSQFTDSIEDDADVPGTKCKLAQQVDAVGSAQNVVGEARYLQSELHQVKTELLQVRAEKTQIEEELGILKAKVKAAEISSTEDTRNVLQNFDPEKNNRKVEMENATLGEWEDEKMEEESIEEGLRVEIRKLQGMMRQAETVITHLKVQLALNSKDGEPTFNPDLIVNMAKEIERLKMETSSTSVKRSAVGWQGREDASKRRHGQPWTMDVEEPENSSYNQDPASVLVCGTQMGAGSRYPEDMLEEQTMLLRSELAQSKRQNRELKDKLVVSEATVHAQTDQLEQYRVLLKEPLVEQNSKQVQVDIQDLGYETCGRSENEVDREETTSPEYDEQEDLFSEASLMEDLSSPYKVCKPLVTSSPLKAKSCSQNDWTMDWEKSEDITVLQQHVKDLKVQLQKSQKVIRNLQSRARSFSASSEGASSQHRLKHSVSFHGSTSHSITDEDEGWQSDSVGASSTKGLEQLVQRVSMLEAQLHKPRRDGATQDHTRSATWPGKYDSLIQAQARELSLLRQKLREGRSVGHILTQHLGDTIKSFEALLRANDVEFYMGQSFREQLSQGNQLAERLNGKLNSKERLEVDDKSRHELLAIRLSKELQQKDKIIETLQSKLDDRSVTPASSHGISESDPSDRTSFVSDDQLSTNDDLEVCSEVATASDYTQYEPGSTQDTDLIHNDSVVPLPSKPSLSTSHEGPPQTTHHLNAPQVHSMDAVQPLPGLHFNPPPNSTVTPPAALPANPHFLPLGPHPNIHEPPGFSLAEVHQELHMLQKQLAESMPLTSPAVKPAHPSSTVFDTSSSSIFPPYFLHHLHSSSKTQQSGPHLRTAQPAFSDSSAVWDMSHLVRPNNANVYGDTSSGSSGYQSGRKVTGSDLLEEHLAEIRNLRQRLEESIHTNDRLREQLEEKLTSEGKRNGSPTKIYIQGLESLPQLSNENRALLEENLNLQVRISQLTRDYFTELEKLQDLLNSSRSQLKEVQLEIEQKKQESEGLQGELEEKQQEIVQLHKERQANQEKCNRLQHQSTLLEQQLNENCQLLHTVQSELQVYEHLYGSNKLGLSALGGETYHSVSAKQDLSELLSEVRSLRTQMEQSIQVNNSIRHHLEQQLMGSPGTPEKCPATVNIFTSCESGTKRQLFQDPIPSPPVRDVGMHSQSCFFPPSALLHASHSAPGPLRNSADAIRYSAFEDRNSLLEGDAPDGTFASKNGRHVISHIDDFRALKQQILEGKMLVHKMETLMQSSLNIPFLEIHGTKALDYGSIKTLFSTTSSVRQMLEEAGSLLNMFWRAALPNMQSVSQQKREEQAMRSELCQLKDRVKEQEMALQEAVERVKSTNRAKESLEQFIVSQLTRTHDVLKKAKSNLEKNGLKVSSGKSHCPTSKGQTQQRPAKMYNLVFQEPQRKKCQLKAMKRHEEWANYGLIQASPY